MIRLSIIVPFYGVEKYIEECIRSLYNQDIPQEEYEVICVDDCSPDGSRAIVEQLQKEYPTLRLLTHMENKRQGGARNTGLREAKGEYVWFVDSDDVVFPNVYKTILSTAEKDKLDVVQFDYVRDIKKPDKQQSRCDEIQEGMTYLSADGSYEWFDKISGPWRQIIRRQFLIDEQIRFVEGVQFEDTDYMLKVLIKTQTIRHISLVAYGYRANTDSTTLAIGSPIKLAWRVNQLVRCADLLNAIEEVGLRQRIIEMVSLSLTMIRKDVKSLDMQSRKTYRKSLISNIAICKPYVNWRTWLAIRYGITCFV